MKRWKIWFKRILPHACIIISGMILTLLIVDYYNPSMEFINNDITKGILLAFVILVVTLAISYIRIRMRALLKSKRRRMK